jgi:hypothetical protein
MPVGSQGLLEIVTTTPSSCCRNMMTLVQRLQDTTLSLLLVTIHHFLQKKTAWRLGRPFHVPKGTRTLLEREMRVSFYQGQFLKTHHPLLIRLRIIYQWVEIQRVQRLGAKDEMLVSLGIPGPSFCLWKEWTNLRDPIPFLSTVQTTS